MRNPSVFDGALSVTVEQYAEFLDDLAARDCEAAYLTRLARRTERCFCPSTPKEAILVGVPDVDGDVWDPRWPATMLNFNDAQAYCTWRSQQDQVTYRLPTEDEWEYAARGADRRIIHGVQILAPPLPVPNARGTKDGLSTVDSFPYDESPSVFAKWAEWPSSGHQHDL